MTDQQNMLCQDIANLGVQSSDTILVHTAFGSLGQLDNGADTIIGALRDAVGGDGTLCMPALSYKDIDWNAPVFDQAHTASCIGFLPEYFRQLPGVQRSMHITHSVSAIGARAQELLGEHHLDHTPGGPHSPYAKMRDAGGTILMIGCGLGPNTTMHAIEETAEAPYLFIEGLYAYKAIRIDASEEELRTKRHGTFGQYYERIAEHIGDTHLRCGHVGQAQAYLIDCRHLWQVAIECMKNDPYCFSRTPS